jgi:hypothetical protein
MLIIFPLVVRSRTEVKFVPSLSYGICNDVILIVATGLWNSRQCPVP